MTDAASNEVELFEGAGALESLDAEWAGAELQSGSTPFQTRAWMRAWLSHLGCGCEPWVLAAGAPPVAFLPLVIERSHGLRILRLMGHGWSDYLGSVPGEVPPATWRALGERLHHEAHRFDVLDFKGLVADAPCIEAFLEGLSCPYSLRLYEVCPRIDTADDWEGFLKGRKKKFRANLKRTQRRVDEQGRVTAGVESLTPPLFDSLVDVERESWKWQQGTAFLQDGRTRELLRSALLDNRVAHEFWAARVDGELAGFAIVLLSGATRYYYLPSFRKSYTDIGTWLMEQIVRDSFESNVEVFDFMQGDEAYKLAWSTGTREVHQLVASGRRPLGAAALAAFRMRFRLAESERLHRWRRAWRNRARRWRGGSAT
jgi:CelD/BcsL family acetyltransferase involved in cellulose biosynthesis